MIMYSCKELVEKLLDNDKIMPIYIKQDGSICENQNVFLATTFSKGTVRKKLKLAFPEARFRLVEGVYYSSVQAWRGFWVKN